MASRGSLRIALKKRHTIDDPPSPPRPKKVAKTNAETSRAYKEKLKQHHPDKYEAYLEAQRERCKKYRMESSDEKKARQREQVRFFNFYLFKVSSHNKEILAKK
jgi:hypothetical protein